MNKDKNLQLLIVLAVSSAILLALYIFTQNTECKEMETNYLFDTANSTALARDCV